MQFAIEQAWITVVREQGKNLACHVTGTSPIAYSVTTSEPLIPGEMVRLRTGDGSVVAEVQQCARTEGHYTSYLDRVQDQLDVLRSVALKELFDGVPANRPPALKVTAATLGFAAVAGVLAVSVFLSLSSGLIDRVSAGQPKLAPAWMQNTAAEVPEPPPPQAAPPASTPPVSTPPVSTPPASVAATSARLSIRATGASWVTGCADGKKLFERLFQEGETTNIAFSQAALVRSGNAGGLEVTFGDKPLGPMGPWGAVRMLQATPQRYDYVSPELTPTCQTN